MSASNRGGSSLLRWRGCLPRRVAILPPICFRSSSSSSSSGSSRRSSSSTSAVLRQGDMEWQLRDPALPPVLRVGDSSAEAQLRLWLRGPVNQVQQMVLPRGFPHSVSPGHAGYTGWLAAGLFAHSFTVMVSTNALLSGFFAEMSAASWLMKDLLPPLVAGTLASRIRSLEANPKKWLGAACFANSLLGVAEFMIPHLLPKDTWMVLAICTNVGKMTGYLVIGASRAVLQKTLATGDNLGEVTAKLGTLGMLMHCFGAATALTLTQFLGFGGQLAALSFGAAVGFYAPVRASQCVVMSSVTTVSLRRLVKRWAAARDGVGVSVGVGVGVGGAGGVGGAALASAGLSSLKPSSSSSSSSSSLPPPLPPPPPPPLPWACPSPEALHVELSARWSVAYSLASRAGVWRELLLAGDDVLRVQTPTGADGKGGRGGRGGGGSEGGKGGGTGGADDEPRHISLHVAPSLSAAADVRSLGSWRDAVRAAGAEPPAAWTLGAGGDGRLLLLYSTTASSADLVEGFACAWLAARGAAAALHEPRREAAEAGLALASAASLRGWRRDAAALHDEMAAAGWQCDGCSLDDISRRIEWCDDAEADDARRATCDVTGKDRG